MTVGHYYKIRVSQVSFDDGTPEYHDDLSDEDFLVKQVQIKFKIKNVLSPFWS